MDGIKFVDTTIRDGHQSLWAENMTTGMMLPVAEAMDRAGFDAIELISSSHLKKCVRELKEDPWARVKLVSQRITRTPLRSFDPSRPQARLVFDGAPAEALGPADATQAIRRLLDRAAVMTGFEQLGGATRAFEATRDYALGRYAFGRPIGSFQAIKHRFADLYAAIELARSNGYYAAWALSSASDELELAACSFRAAASDAFELATREMIQIHGGVGYTWEYDCHLFYRRAKALAAALGSPAAWKHKLVDRLDANDDD